VTQYTNKSITAQRMDLAVIESIGHVRTPSEPNMPSHYRVLAGATPPAISELQEDQRLPMQFGVSKMRINLMDSIVLAGYKARGYIFTTTSEIFDATPDVWRAEGAVGADKMLYLDMVNFWRQVDLDTSKWFVLEILNNAGTPIVRYIWNIKALGDTFEPMVSIIDSGKDYREGVPLEFTICATDEFLEAITDLRVRVNIGQKGWRDLEDVVSDMNPAVDQKEGWLFAVRYHVKVQVFPGLTNYASGLVDDGVDYIVSNAIASLNGTGAHQNAKWFDVFHGKIPGMPTTAAGRSEYWWKTDGYGHILAEDDDNGHWPGNRTPDEEPYDPTPSHNTDELDHRALPKWSYVYEFTDLDTTRVNEIRKEAFVENTTFKVWIYPEVVRVNRADIEAGVTKPEVLDVVDVSIGPGTWRDQHVDYQMQIEIADWRWGGENPDIGKVSQSANFTIDEDEETPRIQISGSYSDDPSQSFKHLFKDQWQWYSPVKNYAVPNFFVHELEVFTGASITIKAQDDIALHDLLVFYDSENYTTCVSKIDSPKADYIGRNDAFSHPLTGFDYVYDEGMLAYRLIKGKETTGEATLVPLVYQSLPATPKAFPIEEPRILRILGKDFKINGKIISPIFTLDKNYEYYVNFTNDDVVDSWAIAAHQNTFGRENDIIRANPVDKEYETYAGEYSTVFLGSKLNTPGTKEDQKAEFTFRVPDVTGDYWLWIVARDRSAQDTKLFDYPFDERHDYKEDTYLGEYPSYATKNRQCEIFGTWFDDGSPNFDKMYYDDSMSEDDADMVILLRLRIKSHSWDIVRLDIHEPDLVSYPVIDDCGNDIWYMHSYHPKLVPNEFDEADLKIPVYDLPRDIYPVYKWVEDKDEDPIGLFLDNNQLKVDSKDGPYNLWKVTDWVKRDIQYLLSSQIDGFECCGNPCLVRIEGVPVVGGNDPTDFRVKTHEDITKLSMYLIEGEYWDTQSVERDYGNLDVNPKVIAKTTKIADPSNISQWGFWEWTLDWNALKLTGVEATYTIAVRGYHKTSDDKSSFYEQFQWPIFVDTKGPVLKLYNVLEKLGQSATGAVLDKHETLQLNIQEEIPQRTFYDDAYPVEDWLAMLAIDRGGLFFEENKGVPTNSYCAINDRRGCEPIYTDYSNATIDEFFILPFDPFVSSFSNIYDCWDYRMAEIRAKDLRNHLVKLWDPCCACSYYPLFSKYSQMTPIASNSYLLGYPGFDMRTELCIEYDHLTLRNSLKYLEPYVRDVEYTNALGIRSILYKEYMADIYSEFLNDDFWYCNYYFNTFCDIGDMREIGLLPEVALFHNIYIRDYCWFNKQLGDAACLAAEMLDELGNKGSWQGMIEPKTLTDTLEATVSKSLTNPCRLNRITVSGAATALLKAIGVKELAKDGMPAGPFVSATISPLSKTFSKPIDGVLLPKFACARDLQIIGTTHDGYNIGFTTSVSFCYAGNKPTIKALPSPADLSSGKVIDIAERLKSLGKEVLVPLLGKDEKYALEGFDGTATVTVNGVITTDDDNLDKYTVYYQAYAQKDHAVPVQVPGLNGVYDALGLKTFTLPMSVSESATMGSVSLAATAADCGCNLEDNVATSLKIWYQNPKTFVVSVEPLTSTAPATGIIVKLQSDILFLSKDEILNSFEFWKNGVQLTNKNVWIYNGSSKTEITLPGRAHWFLFEVSPFNPTASARSEHEGLSERLTPEGNWIFEVHCRNLYSVYGGYIDKLETMNRYPSIPINLLPANGAVGQNPTVTLRWTPSVDPDGDSVRYDVYLWQQDKTQQIVSTNQSQTSKTVYNLENGKTYRWFVLAKDGRGGTSASEVWSFTVGSAAFVTITAQSDPAAGGQVRINSGTWGVNQSAQVVAGGYATLQAAASTGYVFEGWYDGTTLLNTQTSYSYGPVVSPKTIKAKFVAGIPGEAKIYLEKVNENTFQIKSTIPFTVGASVLMTFNTEIAFARDYFDPKGIINGSTSIPQPLLPDGTLGNGVTVVYSNVAEYLNGSKIELSASDLVIATVTFPGTPQGQVTILGFEHGGQTVQIGTQNSVYFGGSSTSGVYLEKLPGNNGFVIKSTDVFTIAANIVLDFDTTLAPILASSEFSPRGKIGGMVDNPMVLDQGAQVVFSNNAESLSGSVLTVGPGGVIATVTFSGTKTGSIRLTKFDNGGGQDRPISSLNQTLNF